MRSASSSRWKIEYNDEALRQLRYLDAVAQRRILDFMDDRIATLHDPRSRGHALTGSLRGFWRYRVGDYRVVCEIHDIEVLILVVRVGHRRDVYER